MKVYQGLAAFQKLPFAVVTSGTFDGVHIGHQKILARLKEISQRYGGESVVITFSPHPRLVLGGDHSDLKLLSTDDEKIELLANQAIDHLLIIHFTKEFSQLSPGQYIQEIYIRGVGTKKMVIGYDHHFGKNREGNFDYLAQNAFRYGFEVEEIPRQDIEDVGVSSTKIRNALLEGNVHIANQYLGSPYSLHGKVVHGDKIGRSIGFPTANLAIENPFKLIPADGIYAIKAKINNEYFKGMLYIGKRPTLNGANKQRIEVNIFDFDTDIYEQEIKVYLIEKIRGDAKFESLELMKQQLIKDGEEARKVLD